MNRFWDLLERSIITQSLITMILVLAVVWMMVTGLEVPMELYSLLTLVLGFWFGAKTEDVKKRRHIKKIKKGINASAGN